MAPSLRRAGPGGENVKRGSALRSWITPLSWVRISRPTQTPEAQQRAAFPHEELAVRLSPHDGDSSIPIEHTLVGSVGGQRERDSPRFRE
jgi:hypothetical protein